MKLRNCSKCGLSGHNKRTCDGVSKDEIQKILDDNGWGVEERFPETGFVYFGDSKRVFWKVEDDAPKGPLALRNEGDIWINESWGYPTPYEITLLYKLVFLYVQYCRQLKRAQLADQSLLHQLAAQGE